jgi:hypothetical protein
MGAYAGPEIVEDGLVLALDAANPKSYPGSGTTWTDLSGNGNTGTLTNGPTYSSANGGSIVFDGVDDGVNLPNKSDFYLIPNQNQTNCGWFNTNNTNTSTIIYDARNSVGSTVGYFIGVQSGGLLRAWFYYTFNDASSLQINTAISAGIWYHYAVVFDRNGLMSLYLNGILKSSVNISSFSANDYSINTNPTIGIKSYSGSGISPFSGNIAQVSIYNRALTPQEIQQNFNATRSRYGI